MGCQIWITLIVKTGDTTMNNVSNQSCPVCGLNGFQPFDELGFPTYDICPCCSFEAGNEYDHRTTEVDFIRLRRIWINEMKAEWWKKPAPKNWSFEGQLEKKNLAF